jgi:ABC-type polysaccharide/polyol phosphate export permease
MDVPIYDSARRPLPMVEELVQVFRYRDLIVQLVRRDILTRYKRSVLGVAWTMLNPLGTMIVLSVVFSRVFASTPAYPVYVLTGLIAWNFFSQSTTTAMTQLVWGSALLHRIYVPRTAFAISSVGTGLVNLVLSLIPLAAVMLFTGVPLRVTVIVLPISMLLLAMFALGVGLLLSAVAVYFPDIAEMYKIVLMAWMYLTPIIYPEEIIPESFRWLLFNLNPMYHLIKLFRLPLYDGVWVNLAFLASATAVAIIFLAISWAIFAKKADEFVYRI